MNEAQDIILREIAQGEHLNEDDRFFIRSLSTDLGVPFHPKSRCKSCYRDQAIILHKKLREAEPVQTGRDYVLRAGVDVIYMGKRINEETLTPELAKWLLDHGFPTKYFARWK